jgi:hypothetical protein
MTDFNYEMPGEFYSRKSQGMKPSGMTYQRFATAAEAIRFAVEALPSAAFAGCMLEANDERFGAKELRALYASPNYPLRRATQKGARTAAAL